jgi:hypothetical protein
MSSIQAAFAEAPKLPTKFSALITPTYDDTTLVTGETIEMPIPFTVVNGVLDINVGQSSVIQTFVSAGTPPQSEASIQGKAFGGVKVITSLGPNMTTYLRNWIENIEDLDSAYAGPLVLYIQPVMTKVQLANPRFAIPPAEGVDGGAFVSYRSWGVTTEAPVSTEYTGGGLANNFFTAFVFKTPMTVQYVIAGGYKYITMTSQFSEE